MKIYSRDKSKMIQGIAILLMIFHHQFSCEFEHYSLINWIGNAVGVSMLEIRIGWLGKMCVGLFAFASGYGICTVLDKQTSVKEVYISILKRVFSFIMMYYMVVIAFAPIEIYKCHVSPQAILKAFLVYDNSYKAGWWYVKQYVCMVLLSPAMYYFLNFKGRGKDFLKSAVISGILFGVMYGYFKYELSWYLDTFFWYLKIFFIGMIHSKFHIFSRIANVISKGNRKVIYGVIMIVFIANLVVRFHLSEGAADASMDVFVVPIFVFCASYLMKESRFLMFLGEKSLWLWLVSAGIQQIFEAEIKLLKSSLIMYLAVLGCSVVIAIVFDWLYKKIKSRICF